MQECQRYAIVCNMLNVEHVKVAVLVGKNLPVRQQAEDLQTPSGPHDV